MRPGSGFGGGMWPALALAMAGMARAEEGIDRSGLTVRDRPQVEQHPMTTGQYLREQLPEAKQSEIESLVGIMARNGAVSGRPAMELAEEFVGVMKDPTPVRDGFRKTIAWSQRDKRFVRQDVKNSRQKRRQREKEKLAAILRGQKAASAETVAQRRAENAALRAESEKRAAEELAAAGAHWE